VNGDGLPPIVGVSKAIQRAVALVERFAPTGLSILLVGATGTGKELLARHIHHRSRRRGELVDVNCGALPREMAESLLFGHRRGAFTGAVESTVGHVERADGGTLFLDEVLHLPPEGQVKLLRVLESGDVQPLGEGRKRNVDLRTVAAAQDDTTERLGLGVFRRDLYQRLAGVVIPLPPLAQRPEDILPLAAHFAARQGRVLEPGTVRELADYWWPGNVRELRLVMERAGCMAGNGTLPPEAVREAIALGVPTGGALTAEPSTLAEAIVRAEEDAIRTALAATGGCRERAAERLGISQATLYRRLRHSTLSFESPALNSASRGGSRLP